MANDSLDGSNMDGILHLKAILTSTKEGIMHCFRLPGIPNLCARPVSLEILGSIRSLRDV